MNIIVTVISMITPDIMVIIISVRSLSVVLGVITVILWIN